MSKRMDLETCERDVYELLGKISPTSYYAMEDFPGMDALGLKNGQHQEDIADGIVYLTRALRKSKRINVDSTEAFGRVVTMLQYGIITKKELETAIYKASESKHDNFIE